jgi:glucose-6-phosphate isomerase
MTKVPNQDDQPMTPRASAFAALNKHYQSVGRMNMRELFRQDENRYERFSIQTGEILLDYSKNLINEETMALLMALARASRVEDWRDRMFHGEKINDTEHRAVLHIALRNRSDRAICVDGEDVMPAVRSVVAHMCEFAGRIRSGDWTGYTGKAITDVVNIGIGGSDLGPQMVYQALKPYQGRHASTFYIQCRWHAYRGNPRTAESGNDAVHRGLENLHHAGNHHQRAYRAALVPGCCR